MVGAKEEDEIVVPDRDRITREARRALYRATTEEGGSASSSSPIAESITLGTAARLRGAEARDRLVAKLGARPDDASARADRRNHRRENSEDAHADASMHDEGHARRWQSRGICA